MARVRFQFIAPLFAGAFALVALVLAVSAGTSRAETADSGASATIVDLLNLDDPILQAGLSNAKADGQAERRAFGKPAAVARRKESRKAFKGASDKEAVVLATDKFAGELAGPASIEEQSLDRGVKVKDYTSQFTARLETATGRPAGLLESSAPLTTDASADEGIDLSLQRVGDGFVAANPRSDVKLPEDGGEPATFAATGVSVAPSGADDSPALERDDRVFYPSVDTDTDYILAPTEQGLESSWQLRSPASPQTLRLHYDLPDGQRLEESQGPGPLDEVRIMKGDQVVGLVHPVTAVDAAGRPVDANMTVDGSDVVIAVDHRSDATQYPELVDPVTESWTGSQWGDGNSTGDHCAVGSPGGDWIKQNPYNVAQPWYYGMLCNWSAQGGYGLWAYTYNNAVYNSPSWVNLVYPARANTYISDVTWGGWRHGVQYGGVADGSTAAVGLYRMDSSYQAYTPDKGLRSAADLPQHTDDATQNQAVINLAYLDGARTSRGSYTGVSWVAMWIRDGAAPGSPTIVGNSPVPADLNVNGSIEKFFPWSSSSPPSLSVRPGVDVGLGVSNVAVIRDDGTPIWGPYYYDKNGNWTTNSASVCTGTRANPCFTGQAATITQPFGATTGAPSANLVEGDNSGRLVTTDAGGRYTWGTRVHVRISSLSDDEPSTTVEFNQPYSVAAVEGALYAVPDLGQILTDDGGLAIGSGQTVADALSQLQASYPEEHSGAPAAITGVVLNAPMVTPAVTSALGGFTTATEADYQTAPQTEDASVIDESIGDTRSTRAPWAPAVGTMRSFVDSSKKLSHRIVNTFKFGTGSLARFNRANFYDYAYEHDLKLYSDDPHVFDGGLANSQPFCVNEDQFFWARRGSGMQWNTDLPKSAKPYFDTAIGDKCNKMDLTIGIKYPQQLNENQTYALRVFSKPPTQSVNNRYGLVAQKIARACGGSVKTCGQTKDEPSVTLIGPTKGRVPECRTWALNQLSYPC